MCLNMFWNIYKVTRECVNPMGPPVSSAHERPKVATTTATTTTAMFGRSNSDSNSISLGGGGDYSSRNNNVSTRASNILNNY